MPTNPKPRGTAGALVWRLSLKWRAAVDRAVAPIGLTHAQYTFLASLRGMSAAGAAPSQRELADNIGLEPLYVSKLARALEAAGLVERSTHPNDARAVQLALTRRGRDTIDRAIVVVRALLEDLTAPLGGTRSERTTAFMGDLELLLANPFLRGVPDGDPP